MKLWPEDSSDPTPLAVAVSCGAVFALGLVLADMTSPARVLAFLDLGGRWDGTLGFVMAGAIAVYASCARLIRRRRAPIFADRFHDAAATALDLRLIAGAAVFGVGWGLSGYCPGPALVAAGTGAADTLVFVAALIAGIAVTRLFTRRRSR